MRMTEEQYQAYIAKGRQTAHKAAAATIAPKPSRYRNTKVIDADGLTHDSKLEYRRWCELQLRERAGEISNLRRQVVFDLCVNGVLVCRYVADAVYDEGGQQVVEDTKSEPTRKKRDYVLKRKLMRAVHGIEIREVM
jgi:hypothetical protein